MHQHKGFSLIETLIAASLLSVGFSGIGLLTMHGTRSTVQADWHYTAILLAEEMQTEIQIMALPDVAGWSSRVANTLPSGQGQFCPGGSNPSCLDASSDEIRVSWSTGSWGPT